MKIDFYRKLIIVLLCFVAGIVDVIGYLNLGRVFTANMTGNIIVMGMAIGNLHTVSFLRSGVAFAGFIAGNAVARLLLGSRKPDGPWSSRLTILVVLQIVFFLLFALLAKGLLIPAIEYSLIILLSFTMGMQTTMARRLGIAGISTTVLTNNMASIVEDVTARLRQLARRDGTAQRESWPAAETLLRVIAIFIYGGGAVIATVVEQRIPLIAIWIVIIVMVIVLGLVWAVFHRKRHGG
ncbi:YoaK family protein [Paenibacillus campi]|uniref:YoaK family protein n=1 Tax=Paenibacillus campi TaxID=3106031 RepID=UPI002AFECCF4|nr:MULTISPECIES: YoaK family protein [unclassified Paenibacillus]